MTGDILLNNNVQVTVCPPKNTFTNLNYDLMAVGNMTIHNPDLLLDNLKRKILDTEFSQAWGLYFDEDNGLRNWYQGHSREGDPLVSMWTKKQTISTSALSGVISTPSFRQPFDGAIFQNPTHLDELYNFTVVIDFSGLTVRSWLWNKMLLDIEADLALGKEQIYVCGSKLWQTSEYSQSVSEHIKVKLQCPSGSCNEGTFLNYGQCSGGKVEVTFSRSQLDPSEVEVKKLQTMTGMRVAWNYSQSVTASERKFLTQNGQFIQLADLCCSYGQENQEQVWEVVKEAKFKWQFDTGSGYTALNILDRVEEQLGTFNLTQSDSCGEAGIRDEDLEAAARMHVYTFTQTRNIWNQVINLFSQERTSSPRFLLLLFGNMKPTNHFEESLKTIAMDTLAQHLGLQFGYIDDVAFMNVSEERREKIVGEKCIGFYANKYKRHK